MTTIATDGKTIAGDGRSMNDSIIVNDHRNKLRVLNDGSIVGFAGPAHVFDDWFNFLNGTNPEWKDRDPKWDADLLMLKSNGTIYINGWEEALQQVEGPIAQSVLGPSLQWVRWHQAKRPQRPSKSPPNLIHKLDQM